MYRKTPHSRRHTMELRVVASRLTMFVDAVRGGGARFVDTLSIMRGATICSVRKLF